MTNRAFPPTARLFWLVGLSAISCVFPSMDVVDEPAVKGSGGSTSVSEQGGSTANLGGSGTEPTYGGATGQGGASSSGGVTSSGGSMTSGAGGSLPNAGSGGLGVAGNAGRSGSTAGGGRAGAAGYAGAGYAGAAGYSGFTVNPNGYVTSGTWQGWPWTSSWGTGSTITPAELASNLTNGRLCVSGTAVGGGTATLGINLNQPPNGSTGSTVSPTGYGLVVNVENRGNSLPIEVCVSNNSISWCAPLTQFGTNVVVPWDGLSTLNSSSGTDLRYARQPINSVQFVVAPDTVSAPFSFCINEVSERMSAPGGAGGAAGAGGGGGAAGTTAQAGSAGAAGARIVLRRWEFGASATAGAAGAATDGWDLDSSSITSNYALAARVADNAASDGRTAQITVLQLANPTNSAGTINPTYSVDVLGSEGQSIDVQGRMAYARWRVVSPSLPSSLTGDTLNLFAQSAYLNPGTGQREGWLWVQSADTPLGAVNDHDWHVTFWPLPPKTLGTTASSYWDPTQFVRLGVVFKAWGMPTGIVPFVIAIDSVWIQ